MYEIVERSLETGGVSYIYSGYETEAEAWEVVTELEKETDDYWWEVRRQTS